MIYLVSEIILFLIAASILGLVVGWMLSTINAMRNADEVARRTRQKTLTLEKEHREEIDDFANNNKRFRAEVTRLNTNNKALRLNINKINHQLEIARSEISLLSEKLKKQDVADDEFIDESEQKFAPGGNEFDKTMAIPEGQDFDSTVIEVRHEEAIPEYRVTPPTPLEPPTLSKPRDVATHN